MLVYRSARRPIEPARVLISLHEALSSWRTGDAAHDLWTNCLIDTGALEAALVDEWTPERDRWDVRIAALRNLTDRVADAALATWSSRTLERAPLSIALSTVAMLDLPECVSARTPDGFAYHALYPETYADAARRFLVELQPARVVVIGIRSIGTSLASVVGAVMRQHGIPVRSHTVRARGQPSDQYLELDDSLRREWCGDGDTPEDQPAASTGALFVVVDDGPRESGSSFAAASSTLASLGIETERVVFFPSGEPDARTLRSESARRRWDVHRRYVGSFDDLYLRSGRLTSAFGGGALTELSAGKWRDVLDPESHERVPVHPQHEQRKFLLTQDDRRIVLKFVGFGPFGAERLALADALARPGFAPHPLAFRGGMLAYPLVEGRPMTRDDLTRGFLLHAARYLSHRALRERGVCDVGSDELLEMIAVNTTEVLGALSVRHERAIQRWKGTLDEKAPVRIDGRLMPHEWLCTAAGWTKSDALSHHDDNFLPGCQDIAWDVAAMIDEWSLDVDDRRVFLDAFVQQAGDDGIEARLPIWRVAYLAFRAGYTKLAAASLTGDIDGPRMVALHGRYAQKLSSALDALARP